MSLELQVVLVNKIPWQRQTDGSGLESKTEFSLEKERVRKKLRILKH